MRNIIKKIDKKSLIVFFVFFLLIVLQNSFVWLYHDDYAYVSLSYVPQYQGLKGLNTGLIEIFDFLGTHYVSWGGRILYFFIEIILLRIGLPAYRIFQSIITVSIFYLIYKIVVKKFNISSWKVACVTTLCYGLFEIAVLRGGIYWITASVLYFVPLLPLLLFVYLYDGKKHNILCGFLIFFATFSQEQVGILAFAYILLYTLYNYFIKKVKNKKDIIMTIIALIGFLILMLAPGSSARMDSTSNFYNLSLVSKVIVNVPEILIKNFGQGTKLFSICFFVTALYFAFQYKKIGKFKKLTDISIFSTMLILIGMILKNEGYFSFIFNHINNNILKLLVILLLACQLLLIFLPIIFYLYKKKHSDIIFLIIGAIASQGVMIMAPYFPDRSTIMFEVVGYILMTYCFSELYTNKKININYILIPIFMVSSFNFGLILWGYYNNNDEKTYNDMVLKDSSKRIKSGEDIKIIELKKQQNIMYGGEEPYEDEMFNYIEIYIRTYYDIPQDVVLIYE